MRHQEKRSFRERILHRDLPMRTTEGGGSPRGFRETDDLRPHPSEQEELRIQRNKLRQLMRDDTRQLEKCRGAYSKCEQAFAEVTQQSHTYYQTYRELQDVLTDLEHRIPTLGERTQYFAKREIAYRRAVAEHSLSTHQIQQSFIQHDMDALTAQQARMEFYALSSPLRLQGKRSKEALQRASEFLHQERQIWEQLQANGYLKDGDSKHLKSAMAALEKIIIEIAPGSAPQRMYSKMVNDREKNRPIIDEAFRVKEASFQEIKRLETLRYPDELLSPHSAATTQEAAEYSELFQSSTYLINQLQERNRSRNPPDIDSFRSVKWMHRRDAGRVENALHIWPTHIEGYLERAEAMKRSGRNVEKFQWPSDFEPAPPQEA